MALEGLCDLCVKIVFVLAVAHWFADIPQDRQPYLQGLLVLVELLHIEVEDQVLEVWRQDQLVEEWLSSN